MRKIIIIILFFSFPLIISGQNNTFVLIDISGNPINATADNRISQEDRKEAISIMDGILNQKIDRLSFDNWVFNYSNDIIYNALNKAGQPYFSKNDILSVIPYGEKNTYKDFKIFNSKYVNVNIDHALDYAENLQYTDQLTFGELARAKAADIAIDAGLDSYYSIEISGLGGDHTGSQGMSNIEMQLVDQYNSSIISESIGLISHENSPLRITIKKIDLKKLIKGKPTGNKGIIKKQNITNHNFRIITPTGTKNDPAKFSNDERVNVKWSVIGAPKGTKYTVEINDQNSTDRKVKTCKDCNSRSFDLKPGSYIITLRGIGLPACENNDVYIKVKSSGNGFFIALIVIALLIGGFIYLRKNDPFGWWNSEKKKQNENKDDLNLNI